MKIGRLPDRTPIKISINVAPDLSASLSAYASLYGETYGHEEAVADLIPVMLSAFLESDKAFIRWCRERGDRDG